MRKFIIFTALLALVLSCSKNGQELDYEALNEQAAQEYLGTIRCSTDNGPFWNTFADKFIYAPAFDFPEAEGAGEYLFTVRYIDDIYRDAVPSGFYTNGTCHFPTLDEIKEEFEKNAGKEEWSFKASSPKASLAPVWNDVRVGNVILKVDALDAEGKVISTVGGTKFLRDFPFSGPYYGQSRSYREAAEIALIFTHCQSFVSYWKDHDIPDPSYGLHGYVCKIIGSTVRNEAKLSQLVPSLKDECLTIARKAADFMISVAQAPGTPLAYFPPTYIKGYFVTADHYYGQTMGMEAADAAIAFLDLYDVCGEQKYFDQAMGIARTYCKIQAEDGSVPIKMYIETGEPINDVKATPLSMMDLFTRMRKQYSVNEFDEALAKAEKWLFESASSTFNLTGQFEDVDIEDVLPFQNICNETYGYYAAYLFSRDGLTKEELVTAKEMSRLVEDQFVHWDVLKFAGGTKEGVMPCVYEQYQYRTPIDASVVRAARAFITEYKVTGDKLALAKGRALADALTRAQSPRTGLINTYFRYEPNASSTDYWLNCNFASALFLTEMAEMFE